MSEILKEFWYLTAEMAPYLLLGFLIAGILHAWFPKSFINKHLGNSSFLSVLKASVLGIPLPLCSCGVIPTGVGLYKSGASKGATNSFMISTPQTGVDSILVTWSMLGLPFAILRPVVALFTGVMGGQITSFVNKEKKKVNVKEMDLDGDKKKTSVLQKLKSSFKYGFYTLPADLAKWLIIGLILAALVSYFVPADFFQNVSKNPFLEMGFMLLVSLPLYVCATGSVPLAAVFLLKGISPGAVLVFLMAGPATNIATITVIGNALGRKSLISYLSSIILGSVGFGLLINYFFPENFFIVSDLMEEHQHSHGVPWFFSLSAIVLLTLLVFSYFSTKYFSNSKSNIQSNMELKVKGMTCQHCKNNVEKAVNELDNVKNTEVNLQKEIVKIEGDNLKFDEIKSKIEGAGYVVESV